jgi:hypothetical protein
MHSRFYDTDLTNAAWARVCASSAGGATGAADSVPRTFVPSSTQSFTSCGQAASGDCCHENFHRAARSTRLSKDYEYRVQTSETMIDLAAIRLMLNRIAPV